MPEITPSLELRAIREGASIMPERFNTTSAPRALDLPAVDRVCRLPDIDALLELINEGAYDEHLEAILAAGHARKRERRGVRRPYGLTR